MDSHCLEVRTNPYIYISYGIGSLIVCGTEVRYWRLLRRPPWDRNTKNNLLARAREWASADAEAEAESESAEPASSQTPFPGGRGDDSAAADIPWPRARGKGRPRHAPGTRNAM